MDFFNPILNYFSNYVSSYTFYVFSHFWIIFQSIFQVLPKKPAKNHFLNQLTLKFLDYSFHLLNNTEALRAMDDINFFSFQRITSLSYSLFLASLSKSLTQVIIVARNCAPP